MHYKLFNRTISQLLSDIATVLPDHEALVRTRMLVDNLIALDPQTKVLGKTFKGALRKIPNHDPVTPEIVFELMQEVFPDKTVLRDTWPLLSEENKQVLVEYTKVLIKHSQSTGKKKLWDRTRRSSAIAEKTEKAAASDDEESSPFAVLAEGEHEDGASIIKRVYNMILYKLAEQVEFKTVMDTMKQLMDEEGQNTGTIYDKLHRVIRPLVAAIDETAMFSAIATGSADGPGGLGADTSSVDSERQMVPDETAFPMSTDDTETFGRLRQSMSEDKSVASMWFYVKMLDKVISDCPPELLTMVGTMASKMLSEHGDLADIPDISELNLGGDD